MRTLLKTELNFFRLILWISLIVATIPSTFAYAAGNQKVDSLKIELQKSKSATTKLDILKTLGTEVFEIYPNEAIVYFKQMRDLALKEKKPDYLGEAYGWLAFLYEQQGEVDSALVLNLKSYSLAKELNHKHAMAVLLNNIGAIYKDKGKIDSALYYHNLSLKIRVAVKDKKGMAVSYSNMGLIYQNQGQTNKALAYYNKALLIQERLDDKAEIASTLHNISTLYKEQHEYDKAIAYALKSLAVLKNSDKNYDVAYTLVNLGDLMQLKGEYKQALVYLEQAILIRIKLDDKQGLANSYLKKGMVYFNTDSLKQAIHYASKALEINSALQDLWGKSRSQNLLSEIYFEKGDLNKSEKLALDALTIAQKFGFPITIKESAHILSKIYSRQADWKQAYNMQKLYFLMHDSIQNIDNTRKAIEHNFRYEYRQKNFADSVSFAQKAAFQKLQLSNTKIKLRQQNSIIISIITVLILITLLAYFINVGKKKSDKLLLNILPEIVAEELKSKGFAEAKLINEVTVLFTDFKSFTQLTEKLSPKELVAEINECFSAFDHIMEKYGVEKIKTIGDSYMAAGGLPTANNTHASDVVNAALAIQDFMQTHNEKKMSMGKLLFEIRIGVHTGPVVAGIVGVKKFAYDIWGDTVNMASRMESSGEVGKVNISATTYALVKDKFTCVYRGKVQAKGKGEIDMYFVDAEL